MNSVNLSSSGSWAEWEELVIRLREAIKSGNIEKDLSGLLAECHRKYEDHLCVSSIDEALAVISGYDCSALEIAFMWMGRWRPTSAIVLVFSTMGVDLKGTVKDLDAFVSRAFVDSNALSETQLFGLSALQKYASEAEADISQQLAVIQMLLVEQNTVAALRLGETCEVEMTDITEFQQLIDVKLKELFTLLEKADGLRLHTLRVLFDLLSPVQAASCIVAAYELVLTLRSLSNGHDYKDETAR
ncbi:hypothetical protein KP509_24G030300 [Ceratopteris richardii]|uniref:DOG1 domain-containing protein n=1 Tax=Ceratopteris richardii TaxID=49495 RepID=A0A8T2RU85_CERRI|nr:hypothetical protein KP509_24G030300 [Ceratopteris richardii]KAH7299799.1 hypothetical protein KP509_24G030300 [Ceratopteris richardii]KAH7299800.1 hypothetical protein KP509_24G030300 [Ceratopteris richardii]